MTSAPAPRILGRLYQSDARSFTFTCSHDNVLVPKIGDLVCAAVGQDCTIYGIITNIRWQSDDLIYQLARTAEHVAAGIIADNQAQRSAGPAISVLMVGFQKNGRFIHALPPRPPLSLEQIRPASPEEQLAFTAHSRAYLRLILEAGDLIPIHDVLAAHLMYTYEVHSSAGNAAWLPAIIDHLVDVLADDYDRLISLLEVVAEQIPNRGRIRELK